MVIKNPGCKKVIVMGLDGASFELIDPWIKEGELPNIKMIKENGVWGDMNSCLPPVTAPNWKCYSTGKNPGKLGIFWWENIDIKNKRIYFPQNRTKSSRELVDIIGKKGTVATINMPTTYPPKRVNGILISGPPDAPDDGFYYPDRVKEKLDRFGYKVRPERRDLLNSESKEEQRQAVEEIKDIIRTKFDFAYNLIREENPIFLHLTIFYINVLHHFFWDDEFTKEAWQLIDEKIGEFLNDFGDDYTFFFMSDHGSNKIETVFNINTWLEEKGYLRVNRKMKMGTALNRTGVNIDNVVKIANTIFSKRIIDSLKGKVPKRVLNSIPPSGGTYGREEKGNVIDWNKSKAVASGQGPIYIIAEDDEKERIKGRLKQDLKELVKKGIIKQIEEKEDIYSGKYFNEAPDIVLDQGKGIHIKGDIGKKRIYESPSKWKGENKSIGLFMAYGQDIGRNRRIENPDIIDIAPTILHFLGLPIPKEMDGRVLKEIFKEDLDLAKRSVVYESNERDRIKKRVKEFRGL